METIAYTTWTTGETTEVIVQNIVYTCSLTCKSDHTIPCRLNLHRVFSIFGGGQAAQLNKRKFAAVILRVSVDPIVAILLFEHGRIVCTGAKKKQQAKREIARVVKTLAKYGYPDIFLQKLTVQNLVANAHVPYRVNQQALSLDHSDYCTFDNEAFPGVIIRHPEVRGKLTVLLFASGKMVVTGAKQLDDVTHALEKVKSMIESHTIHNPGTQFNDTASNMFSKSALEQNQNIRDELQKSKEDEEDTIIAKMIEAQLEAEMQREKKIVRRMESKKRKRDETDEQIIKEEEEISRENYVPTILRGLKGLN